MKEGWREGGSGFVCEREMETGCVCLCVREVPPSIFSPARAVN
jgi:hypothetical protein